MIKDFLLVAATLIPAFSALPQPVSQNITTESISTNIAEIYGDASENNAGFSIPDYKIINLIACQGDNCDQLRVGAAEFLNLGETLFHQGSVGPIEMKRDSGPAFCLRNSMVSAVRCLRPSCETISFDCSFLLNGKKILNEEEARWNGLPEQELLLASTEEEGCTWTVDQPVHGQLVRGFRTGVTSKTKVELFSCPVIKRVDLNRSAP